MTQNRRELDALLDRTTREIRDDLPEQEAFDRAADRVWERLRANAAAEAAPAATAGGPIDPERSIGGCDDVRSLIPTFVAGELPEGRALLVEDHTRSCLPCRRALLAEREGRAQEAATAPPAWHRDGSADSDADAADGPRSTRWLLAAAAVLVVGLGVAILAATGLLPGTPFGAGTAVASVESLDGGLFLVDGDGNRPLRAGDDIGRGQEVRTAKGSGAVVRLADGSRVELAERTELAVFPGNVTRRGDTTLDLDQGSVIVEAAKRSRGHLFVDTEDCRVAVTGTIFAVNHGTKGSRVSVIEGSVRVEQGRREDLLRPGDQVTTRATLTAVPLSEEIAWSRDLDRYLALLAELNALHEEIRQAVDAPLPRTSTRLLDLAPAGTTVYAAAPNVAEELSEARRVFTERLAASPMLADLVGGAGDSGVGSGELDRMIARIRDYGSFLGDEVALAMVGDPETEGTVVAYAEVLEPAAFRAFLEQEIASAGDAGSGDPSVRLVDDPAAAGDGDDELLVWLPDGLVVASPDAAGLAAMAQSLATGGGAAGTGLHDLVADAYADGVEWLLAVDLASLMDFDHDGDALGFEDAEYLMVRWSESGERPAGQAVLAFDGPRRGIVSWLAEPAPMGSLEFVTADATAAAAFVVRDPLELADELTAILLRRDPEALAELERLQQEQGFDLRHDLAEPLGGEFAFALDGPLAPKPSFKAVVEVYDPDRLQQTLEWMVERLNVELTEGGATGSALTLTPRELGGRTVWELSTPAEGIAAYYTFVDSYLVAAPSAALLDQAIRARQTGAHLLASQQFRELLPKDGFANFSAVVYQDLGSRLGPIADALAAADEGSRELTAEEQATLEEAGKLHPPSLGYAYGLEDRLVFAASFGGDGMLPLSALIGSGGSLGELGGGLGGLARIFETVGTGTAEGGS